MLTVKHSARRTDCQGNGAIGFPASSMRGPTVRRPVEGRPLEDRNAVVVDDRAVAAGDNGPCLAARRKAGTEARTDELLCSKVRIAECIAANGLREETRRKRLIGNCTVGDPSQKRAQLIRHIMRAGAPAASSARLRATRVASGAVAKSSSRSRLGAPSKKTTQRAVAQSQALRAGRSRKTVGAAAPGGGSPSRQPLRDVQVDRRKPSVLRSTRRPGIAYRVDVTTDHGPGSCWALVPASPPSPRRPGGLTASLAAVLTSPGTQRRGGGSPGAGGTGGNGKSGRGGDGGGSGSPGGQNQPSPSRRAGRHIIGGAAVTLGVTAAGAATRSARARRVAAAMGRTMLPTGDAALIGSVCVASHVTRAAAHERSAATDGGSTAVPLARGFPRMYCVEENDTLFSIAEHAYGNGHRYTDILAANPELESLIAGHGSLLAGSYLRLPPP